MITNPIFMNKKPIIGVVHLLPLPSSPKFQGDLDTIINRALTEVKTLKQGGVDAIIIENFHDMPFINGTVPLELYGLMASILTLARHEVNIPLGVNVHFNDWKAELSLAYTCKAQFIRVESFVDTVVTLSGIVNPCCAEVTRYRTALGIGKEEVQIWADIQPKYSRNLLATPLHTSYKMAEEALADCVIVTGETTGMETPLDDIREVKTVAKLPIVAGSGVSLLNVVSTLEIADGAIIGSAFKESGDTQKQVSLDKIKTLIQATQPTK